MEKTCCTSRSSAKRAAILGAAQCCFLEHGYASTSMDMVATRAGVSKATIYAHFQGKDDLFAAIIARRCDDEGEGLGAITVDERLSARDALTIMARHLMEMLLRPEVLGIYRMVVAEAARHPDLAQVFYSAGPMRGKARMTEIVQSLHSQGKLNVPEPWLAVDQFIGMLRAECFHRCLLGLEVDERCTMAKTVAGAVEVMLRAYAPTA